MPSDELQYYIYGLSLREKRTSKTMAFSSKLQVPKPVTEFSLRFDRFISSDLFPSILRIPARRRFSSLCVKSESSSSSTSNFTAIVGAPSLSSSFIITERHIMFLNVVAFSVAISATWLFLSVIPSLLSSKKAAESFEKLMDEAREELPDTMASIRLSGMEICDLTTELSDLSQEITQGVRRSTRAVRMANERLRSFTKTASPTASLKEVQSLKNEMSTPLALKGVREGIVKGRAFWGMFLSLIQFSRSAINYLIARRNPKKDILK